MAGNRMSAAAPGASDSAMWRPAVWGGRGADRFRFAAVARAFPTGSPGRFFQEGSAETHRYDSSYFRPQDTVPTDLMLVAIAHGMRSKCVGGAQPWQ